MATGNWSKTKKKHWRIKSLDGARWDFFPIFEVNEEDTNIETKFIDVLVDGEKHRFNYLDLWMFMYFCGNEEARRSLAKTQQKSVSMIPYEVTFKLSREEIAQGVAQRRIELPVNELAMAIARNEAWKNAVGNPNWYKSRSDKNIHKLIN